MTIKIGVFVIFTLTSMMMQTGCKTRQKSIIPKTEVIGPNTSTIPSNSAPDSLLSAIRSADVQLKWFSAKVNVKAEIESQSNSVNANLRIHVDSSIWMSISPALGIEVARVLITRDSIKLLNRLNATYFSGDYDYLNKLLQIEVNFDMVQSILLGNTYLHYTVENYISDRDEQGLILSTLRKRKIKKETELELPQVLTQEIWFSALSGKIMRMEMQDYRPVRKLKVNYLSFIKEEDKTIPQTMLIQAEAEKHVKIELEYSKLTVSKELNLPFSIPKNYERVVK
ncbi:MAG: DUF4292 domain-containing protein [Bacteroidia bacterium]